MAKVLDCSKTTGTSAVLNAPSAGTGQLFTVQPDGEIQLSNPPAGGDQTICLDVRGANYSNGAVVETWPCNGGNNQKWTFAANGEISPVGNTNYCLDVKGFGTAAGTPVQIYGCNGGSNQIWSLSAGG